MAVRLALLMLALVAAASASSPCRNVVCPRREEFEATNCDMCQVAFKISNEDPDNGICCKQFGCKQDPERPCCGRTCDIPDLATADARCNAFSGNSILDSLNPAFGTLAGSLERPAKPDKGKCCDKYRCNQDFDAFCANVTAKQPCITSCPACHDTIIEMPADPAAGRCCPVVSCQYNAQLCCNSRANTNCPMPTCDPLEDPVVLEPARPSENCCCPRMGCQPNNIRVCAAKVALDPLGPRREPCAACEIEVTTRPADPARGECYPRTECVPDPTNRCCGFDFDSCPAPPTCGPFADLEITRPANNITGDCCNRYACVDNFTRICDAFVCEYPTAADYQAARCPNPPNRNWYFVRVKSPVDVSSGRCCAKFVCKETTEKKLYDLEQQAGRRRRRRRS